MIQIIKELNIEVTKPNIFQALVAKQYDMNTRFLKVTLMDCGTRIDVPYIETAKVVINAERKDGQSKGFEGTINEDGTVTVPLHSWMLELDGTVICDISVIDTATDDNKKLTTTSFTLIVEKAAFGGEDITNDPQFDVLVSLMEAATVAQEALDKSNEANSKYDACVEATENANAVVNKLGDYVKTFQDLEEGIVTLETDLLEEIHSIAIESTDYPGCFYRKIGNQVEWINPPMSVNVEYRTTERCQGRAVYVKRIAFTTAKENEQIEVDIVDSDHEQDFSIVGMNGYIYEDGFKTYRPYPIADSEGNISNTIVAIRRNIDGHFYLRILQSTFTLLTAEAGATVTVKYIKN